MAVDEDKPEDEGMGTSGEIRRTTGEARDKVGRHRSLSSLLRAVLLKSVRSAELEEAAGEKTTTLAAGDAETVAAQTASYDVYAAFIKDELEVQDRRKASFEQRGLAVITTSGTLVTLLFALAALSTKQAATFTLPGAAKTWLSVALVLFFGSAIAALVSNAPLIYQAVPASKIRERLRERPPRGADAAARDVAFTRLDALESAKKNNSIKGWALAVAMTCEALAVGCVAVAIWLIL
jgi:hypothetical protein